MKKIIFFKFFRVLLKVLLQFEEMVQKLEEVFNAFHNKVEQQLIEVI